ncbi:MAG TPA: IspD/TarI family cytidylyltransferase [Acidimicrobiales bacterium]|nr:IspD/TarI family cytidylyltransferase [Acidimicrobiales bacterium]
MGETWAIVVAAGSGRRYGGAKQYERLGDRRVIDWSLATAKASTDGVVAVVADGAPEEPDADRTVTGADTRSGSVRAGLAAVPGGTEVIVVHDAARPLASAELFAAVIGAVRDGADAALPGLAVADTLRHRDGSLVDRDELVAVQTPQAFAADRLRAVHASAPEATDDASLVEAAGGTVVVVPGEPANRKITDPDDLVVAAALLGAAS